MASNEFPGILPDEVLSRMRVVTHDSENDALLTCLGETSHGTPVWANRAYAESEVKIVVGNIEPHQFAGFSGGVKSGSDRVVRLEDHQPQSFSDDSPQFSLLGKYETNPARQDIEEIGRKSVFTWR